MKIKVTKDADGKLIVDAPEREKMVETTEPPPQAPHESPYDERVKATHLGGF